MHRHVQPAPPVSVVYLCDSPGCKAPAMIGCVKEGGALCLCAEHVDKVPTDESFKVEEVPVTP